MSRRSPDLRTFRPAAFEGYPGLAQAIFGWAAETGRCWLPGGNPYFPPSRGVLFSLFCPFNGLSPEVISAVTHIGISRGHPPHDGANPS